MDNNALLAGAWRSRYDEVAVNGWLALNDLQGMGSRDWGFTFSSIPSPGEDSWGLSIGR